MVEASSSTRDRIIDAAMRLFGEHGYRGTSVASIEAAAGLTPGAGGLYHHFASKEAVLTAGIERHLSRLDALRDIRRLFLDLGDLRAELTVTARYLLAELDNENELLRVLVDEARRRPQLLAGAVDQLVSRTHTDFAAWLSQRTDGRLTAAQATAITSVGLGALLSSRLLQTVLGPIPDLASPRVDDETFVTTWVRSMLCLIEDPPPLAPRSMLRGTESDKTTPTT
ncbi:MAG: TetR family transcriptional regulator [Streptosporangiales bacterium]|nr:TetR family transcriptional regulator [Streptosporangiales bacterium]